MITNAKLIDPRNAVVHENLTIFLAEGKVLNIRPTENEDLYTDFLIGDMMAESIDASGYFVCPGLIDCEFYQSKSLRSREDLGIFMTNLDTRSCTYHVCTRKQC